jgi:hypothetical protein
MKLNRKPRRIGPQQADILAGVLMMTGTGFGVRCCGRGTKASIPSGAVFTVMLTQDIGILRATSSRETKERGSWPRHEIVGF